MKPQDDLCDACGYHLILKKVIDLSDMPKPRQATGFERMLQDQLHDSESSQGTMLWIKVIATLLLVAIMFLCLGPWWWMGVLAVGAGVAYYWTKYRKRTADAAPDSRVNRDPLAATFWSALLYFERAAGWPKPEWPVSRARALALCDPNFKDDDLSELTGLADIEALDLEGTGITNDGLEHLRDQKQLRFLVVRRTGVTPSGAAQLQQNLPQVLIWY